MGEAATQAEATLFARVVAEEANALSVPGSERRSQARWQLPDIDRQIQLQGRPGNDLTSQLRATQLYTLHGELRHLSIVVVVQLIFLGKLIPERITILHRFPYKLGFPLSFLLRFALLFLLLLDVGIAANHFLRVFTNFETAVNFTNGFDVRWGAIGNDHGFD